MCSWNFGRATGAHHAEAAFITRRETVRLKYSKPPRHAPDGTTQPDQMCWWRCTVTRHARRALHTKKKGTKDLTTCVTGAVPAQLGFNTPKPRSSRVKHTDHMYRWTSADTLRARPAHKHRRRRKVSTRTNTAVPQQNLGPEIMT